MALKLNSVDDHRLPKVAIAGKETERLCRRYLESFAAPDPCYRRKIGREWDDRVEALGAVEACGWLWTWNDRAGSVYKSRLLKQNISGGYLVRRDDCRPPAA
jgi:hypothetical protein